MSKGPLLALGLVCALGVGVGALLWLGGGGRGGEGSGDGDGAAVVPSEAAPREASGLPAPGPAGVADGGGLAASAPVGNGAVLVRVYDGTTRVPLAGVPVSLTGASAAGARVSVSARTNASGEARLEAVPAGRAYALRAVPAATRPVELHEVAVRDGEITDAGILWTGARGVVEGLVLDDRGSSIEGVEVTASADARRLADGRDPFPRVEPFARPAAVARTDPSGSYRLDELPAGLVVLRAEASGHRTAVARVLVVDRPEPVERNLVLTRGFVLRGQVVDGAGTGVRDAEVTIFGYREDHPRETTRTDAEGRFEIPGFGAERTWCDVAVRERDAASIACWSIRTIEEPLLLVLGGGATLEVAVIDQHTDQPIRGAEVRHGLSWGRGQVEPLSELRTTTDASGVARLDLRPGTVPTPFVKAPGFRSMLLVRDPTGKGVFVGCRVEGDVTRPLAERETRSVRVFLSRRAVVFGRVTWANGTGARGRSVALVGPKGEIGRATTDAAGDYKISDVPPLVGGTLSVGRPSGVEPFVVPVPVVGADDAGVRVDARLPDDPVDEASASAKKEASVRGRVVDATGAPVPGARVDGGVRPVWTDATGSYHVPDGHVLPGKRAVDPTFVAVKVTADGFLGSVRLNVPANVGDEVRADDVVLGVGSTVKGTVVGPAGAPVPFARVWLKDDGDVGAVTADKNGVFVLDGVPTRWARVFASGDRMLGVATCDAMAPVKPNVVSMRTVTEVRGRVVSRGSPLEGARVNVVFDGSPRDVFLPERERVSAMTGPTGEFRVYSTAANVQSLQVWAQGWPTKTVPIPTTAEPIEVVFP